MTEEADDVNCWDCPTHNTVLAFAESRYAALARKVIFRLQRIEASGIYGDDDQHRTLWDEYCHEVQNGPYDMLEGAWRATVDPIFLNVIEAVPHQEAALLTVGAMWNLDRDVDMKGETPVARDLIYRSLEREAANAAMERDMSRFDPLGGALSKSA
jgi:hypothetical protein